jgi:hypothetical protein
MAQLRKMAYGDQGLTVNFINYIINRIHNESNQSRALEMAGTAF